MELTEVVPWGRSLHEYRKMFSLSASDLKKKILGCGDGPASFNAEWHALGGDILSVDPIYQFSAGQIRSRIGQTRSRVMQQVALHGGDYIWNTIENISELERIRMQAMQKFLEDHARPASAPRYVAAALPELPFASDRFDLALNSHCLFLYSTQLDAQLHVLAMKELCRVAREVRVYPLVTLEQNLPSPHLQPVREALQEQGIETTLVEVEYRFQRGATHMLVARRN